MIYALTPASDPVSPVSVAEMRQHLQQPPEDQDSRLGSILVGATANIEDLTGLALSSRAFVYEAVNPPVLWPQSVHDWVFTAAQIRFPRRPVTAVASVSTFDHLGVETELESGTDFFPLVASGLVALEGVTVVPGGRIRVTFTAGYASAADVPQPIKEAIALLAAGRYENRTPYVIGTIVSKIPDDVRSVLGGYLRVTV